LLAGATLPLGPLNRDETAAQLGLLGGRVDADLVNRIHRRSQGQPLFTEQLAAQPDGQPMPQLLADLLDQRLDGLGRQAWSVARALGVADRALDDRLLTDITRLNGRDLAEGLHDLESRHLLRPATGHRVELGHPLQAEAIRRRLVISESIAEHRRIAEALARSADPSPAEVAEHWQRAEDPAEEIVWRIRAAKVAAKRFALLQAGAQWRRVLDLWPGGDETVGSPPTRKGEAYLAAMDALANVNVVAAGEVAEEGLRTLADFADTDAAEILQRAAHIKGRLGDPEGGLVLVDRAIVLQEPTAPSVGYVRALQQREMSLDALGRYDEARAASERALAACADVDAPQLLREILIEKAYGDVTAGDLDRGLASLDAAASIKLTDPDPEGDIDLAISHTHVLMMAGRVGEEVIAAGRPGLEAAAAWGLETIPCSILRGNMSRGLRLAGEVQRAADLIDPVLLGHLPTFEDGAIQIERASLDMLRGRCAAALARYDALTALPVAILANRIEFAEQAATTDLWCGRPRVALDRLEAVLRESMATDASAESSADLALAARAAADIVDPASRGADGSRDLISALQELRGRAAQDPFGPSQVFAARPAHAAAWAAESARLAGRPSLELWADAARQWDRLSRPHDAAYCRWRAAEVALTAGRGTIATRLLRRAAREAREHVPLAAAIAETAEKAPRAQQRTQTSRTNQGTQ
jgi:tetratricopeptide (TPR) repeat protein